MLEEQKFPYMVASVGYDAELKGDGIRFDFKFDTEADMIKNVAGMVLIGINKTGDTTIPRFAPPSIISKMVEIEANFRKGR